MGRYVGIDPSTKTGLVILDEKGNVIVQEEISATTDAEPQRFIQTSDRIETHLQDQDKILIEGFAFGAKGKGVSTQFGVGWSIREKLVRTETAYIDIAPSQLKKFATGNHQEKKENMILPIYKKWGFENDSDNVRDAYILAQIGRYLDGLETPYKYQEQVIKSVKGG